jgi:hypothetical protein
MFIPRLGISSIRGIRIAIAALAVSGAMASLAPPVQALTVSNTKPLGPCTMRVVLRGDDIKLFRADGTVTCPTRRYSNVEVRLKLNGYEIDFATSYLYSGDGWLKTRWWYSNASCGYWSAVTNAAVTGVGRGYVTTGQPIRFCRG